MSHNLNQIRDRAIQKISQGKELYFSGNTLALKQNGFNMFKDGLVELHNYSKLETNDSLRQLTQEKIRGLTDEAGQMKAYLLQNQSAGQPVNIQQQQGQQNAGYNQPYNVQSGNNVSPNTSAHTKAANKRDPNEEKKEGQPEKITNDENEKLKQSLEGAIVTEKPNVKWDDVAGLENAKKSLQEAVILPIRFPEIFKGARKPWMGILLYGPPGTGKTFLAKACATECEGTFFSVSSSDLISKYVGESERLIKSLFQMAREKKPSIIFIDEVDSMTASRDGNQSEGSKRVMTEFLVQMQGVGTNNEGILVLGATNLPWALDSAIRRRFEKRIYIPLPDEKGREALLKNRLTDTPCAISNEEMFELVRQLDGYSGSDMNVLIRDASMEAIRKCGRATHFKLVATPEGNKYTPCSPSDPKGQPMKMLDIKSGQLLTPPLEIDDFFTVLPRCKASVGKGDLKQYEDWTRQFGQEG